MESFTKKKCRKCGEEKPTSEFPRQKENVDGLHSWCRACKVAHSTQWKKDHPEWVQAYQSKANANVKKFKDANREKVRKDGRTYYHRVKTDPHYREKNTAYQVVYREKNKGRIKEQNRQARATVLAHYGGFCVCCGSDDQFALTLDHVNNDGGAHRKAQKKGGSFYKWIIANRFPADLQILCWGCNMGKHLNNGTCPHQEVSIVALATARLRLVAA